MTSPYKTQFVIDSRQGADEISQQVLTTYVWKNDALYKITTKRIFFENDYTDHKTTEVLVVR